MQTTVEGKEYRLCYTHHTRYCKYTAGTVRNLSPTAALEKMLTEEEEEVRRRYAPEASRALQAPEGDTGSAWKCPT